MTLAGCKPADSRTANPNSVPVSTIGGLTVPERKNFSSNEMAIGKRICAAFKYKREKMARMTEMAEKFSFTGTWKACGDKAVTLAPYLVSISNITGELKYIPDSSNTKSFSDVLSDTTEPMHTLCSNLDVSVTVSNFIILGGTNFFVKLYTLSGYDTYELAQMSKNAKGAYSLVNTQSIGVITSTTPSLDIRLLGIEKYRTFNSTCAGSTDYSSIGHTFVNATTAYKLPTE